MDNECTALSLVKSGSSEAKALNEVDKAVDVEKEISTTFIGERNACFSQNNDYNSENMSRMIKKREDIARIVKAALKEETIDDPSGLEDSRTGDRHTTTAGTNRRIISPSSDPVPAQQKLLLSALMSSLLLPVSKRIGIEMRESQRQLPNRSENALCGSQKRYSKKLRQMILFVQHLFFMEKLWNSERGERLQVT